MHPAAALEILDPVEAAAVLRVSPRTLWARTRAGEIKHFREGRLIRYRKLDLIQYVEDAIERTMAEPMRKKKHIG